MEKEHVGNAVTSAKEYLVDKRKNSEWLWKVDENLNAVQMPIVEPWKCPYHNGRMCLEIIKRVN